MLVNRSSRDRADTLKQQPAAPTLRDDERSHRTPKNCRITRHRKRLMMLLAQSEADELLLRRAAEADPHSLGHLARPQLRAKRAAGQISKAKEKARLAESSAYPESFCEKFVKLHFHQENQTALYVSQTWNVLEPLGVVDVLEDLNHYLDELLD